MALLYVRGGKSLDLQLRPYESGNENGDSMEKGNSTQVTTNHCSIQCFPVPPSSTYTTVRTGNIHPNGASDSDMTGSHDEVPNHMSPAFLGEQH